jgi:hypothetical protein
MQATAGAVEQTDGQNRREATPLHGHVLEVSAQRNSRLVLPRICGCPYLLTFHGIRECTLIALSAHVRSNSDSSQPTSRPFDVFPGTRPR